MLTRSETAGLHPLHRVWRLVPRSPRRRALAHALALLAPRPDRNPGVEPGLAVAGELSRASGLGEGARRVLEAGRVLGLPTWGIDVRPPFSDDPRAIEVPDNGLPPAGVPLVFHINAPMMPLAMLRLPRELFRRRRVIAYWLWELPVVAPEWRASLPLVHEIWTPSSFSAAALASLAPGRVRVVPYPLAALARPAAVPDRTSFGLPTGAVVVLSSFSLASSFARKNPLNTIAAFRLAFGDRPDRVLALKIGHAAHFPDDLQLIRAAVGASGNIRVMTQTLLPERNASLMASADIVLSLHRSEGFGLVSAEAMLMGKPVVATAWSGNMDFMDETCAALVPARLIPSEDPRGVLAVDGAVWAEPDVEVAAAHLRRLADDADGRVELGARGQGTATARLTLEPLAEALRSLGLKVR
jgi:glycosyltransferase involved in cell wall biosynthesis